MSYNNVDNVLAYMVGQNLDLDDLRKLKTEVDDLIMKEIDKII